MRECLIKGTGCDFQLKVIWLFLISLSHFDYNILLSAKILFLLSWPLLYFIHFFYKNCNNIIYFPIFMCTSFTLVTFLHFDVNVIYLFYVTFFLTYFQFHEFLLPRSQSCAYVHLLYVASLCTSKRLFIGKLIWWEQM